MKSWNGLNILEYIEWLMDQGINEETANRVAESEFMLDEPEEEEPLRFWQQNSYEEWD